MIRVLIADDSARMRTMIRRILESDSELDVVGEARDGVEGLRLCHSLKPDIITTDIRMPRMDGYELIRRVMAERPSPILVVTSAEPDEESGIAFKATECGAIGVLGKPNGMPGDDSDADRLIAEVKAMADIKVIRRRIKPTNDTAESKPVARQVRKKAAGRVDIIAIGASTGGPPALQKILAELPAKLEVPVLLVQHISGGFVAGMAEWLNKTVPQNVKIAERSELLVPGTAYLAPGDRHMIVRKRGFLSTSDADPVGGHRPAVTVMFESVARTYGALAVGVILTGMGRDGAAGMKVLHDAGGHTIAQDEESSVIFGMPKEAIKLGAVDEVISLSEMAGRLKKMLSQR